MRTMVTKDDSHGENRPIVEYIPETEEDLKELERMAQKGELSFSRGDDRDAVHLKIEPGVWAWVMAKWESKRTLAAHAALVATLDKVRPQAWEVTPAIMHLEAYLSEVVGLSGLREIAEQARLLVGDEELLDVLQDDPRTLLMGLSIIDIDSLHDADDETAPGQGTDKGGKR